MKIQHSKKYKDILKLFDEIQHLVVRDEDTPNERIQHAPSGYYFFTANDGIIPAFWNDTKGSLNISTPEFIKQWFFTHPNTRIQERLLKARTAFEQDFSGNFTRFQDGKYASKITQEAWEEYAAKV